MHSTLIASMFVILAQADPTSAIQSFKTLLAKILLLVGISTIAYGGFLIAKQGQTLEGILCLVGGFLIALAVPIITYFASLGGIQF